MQITQLFTRITGFQQVIDFRACLQEDTYVVWVAGINRYFQLKEPAFRAFELWAKGRDIREVAKECAEQYSLPEEESIRFVEEITGEIQALFDDTHPETGTEPAENSFSENPDYFSDHAYRIGNHLFRFIYRDEYLEELFHPLFRHNEIKEKTGISTCIEIVSAGGQDAFRVNNSPVRFYPTEELDAFQGAVLMEVINAVHGKSIADWMGVLHASAVTDGKSAVVFAAPSGSGKSSVALLMMENGFSILSDDFVPVAMREPEIYHFPASVSVKKSAVPFLQEYLPNLNFTGSDENEFYLPAAAKSGILSNVRAKAIVFVKYDPSSEYELKKESNLEVMNQLITQSWIAGTPEAADVFLKWYFNLPVYTLRYSDNSKAVEGIRGILGEMGRLRD